MAIYNFEGNDIEVEGIDIAAFSEGTLQNLVNAGRLFIREGGALVARAVYITDLKYSDGGTKDVVLKDPLLPVD